MKNLNSINKEQKLYVLKCGSGFSCLGFDVVKKRLTNLAKELNLIVSSKNLGSKKMLKEYYKLVNIVKEKFEATGFRSDTELYKPFIGNEGKRVEVVYTWDEKERFYIGKSTGFIPCHIMIKQKNSHGGGSVLEDSIKSFRFI